MWGPRTIRPVELTFQRGYGLACVGGALRPQPVLPFPTGGAQREHVDHRGSSIPRRLLRPLPPLPSVRKNLENRAIQSNLLSPLTASPLVPPCSERARNGLDNVQPYNRLQQMATSTQLELLYCQDPEIQIALNSIGDWNLLWI